MIKKLTSNKLFPVLFNSQIKFILNIMLLVKWNTEFSFWYYIYENQYFGNKRYIIKNKEVKKQS